MFGSGLPRGSQGVTVVSRLENPVILYQNLSCEFVVSSQTLGQTFPAQRHFRELPGSAAHFWFFTPQAGFATLNRSISSWNVTEALPTCVAGPGGDRAITPARAAGFRRTNDESLAGEGPGVGAEG